jgi:hypothetical protein
MPALVKYALLSVADLTITGVLVHYLLARLRWYTPIFTPPYEIYYGISNFGDFSYFDRLKRISYCAVVVVGIFISLYGAFDFLFSWMPHGWGGYDEDGEWQSTASHYSALGAFFGGVALLSGLEITAEKVSELQRRQSESEAFNKLLRRAVARFGRPETAADHFAKLEQEIDKAESSGAVCFDDARICDDLISIFRLAMKEKQATSKSPQKKGDRPANPWLGTVARASRTLANDKPQMQAYLEAIRDQRELYGADTKPLGELIELLNQSPDLTTFLKVIGAPETEISTPSISESEMTQLRSRLQSLRSGPAGPSTSTPSSPEGKPST